MAILWLQDTDRKWAVLPLERDRLELDRVVCSISPDAGLGGAALVRTGGGSDGGSEGGGGSAEWALLARSGDGIRVNGLELPLGIRILRSRDEIRLGSAGTAFFSTESLARVAEYAGAPVECPRCGDPIEAGLLTVRCPGCDVLYHYRVDSEGREKPCWEYAPTCRYCPQPTQLDAGWQWTPEDL